MIDDQELMVNNDKTFSINVVNILLCFRNLRNWTPNTVNGITNFNNPIPLYSGLNNILLILIFSVALNKTLPPRECAIITSILFFIKKNSNSLEYDSIMFVLYLAG